jgi:hypothetical protein
MHELFKIGDQAIINNLRAHQFSKIVYRVCKERSNAEIVRSYQPLLGQHALLDVNACEIEQ